MLVGRGSEVDEVARAVDEREVVVLTGPAGIGKTTVARAGLGSDRVWAEGGALATLAWIPYLVFRRMIDVDVTGEPGAVAGSVARSLARRGCTAMLIDDAQWADDATLDVVAELTTRFAVVATVRSDEPRSAEVVDAFASLGGRTVELAPLSTDDAHHLLTADWPALTERERATVIGHAAGNPLLLNEFARADPADPTLVSALLHRSRGLDAHGRIALERLAVLGRPSPPELLGDGTTGLVHAGLAIAVAGAELVSVRHPLFAEVLVESIGTRADRIRFELAERVPAAEAAHLLAAAGDPAGARDRALEAVSSTDDPLDRAQLLRFAVDCAPDDPANLDRRIDAGNLFCDVSRLEEAAAICTIDDDVADPVRRGELRSVAARAAWLAGDAEACRRHVDAALADLSGTDTPAEVFALAGSTILDTRVALDGRPALQRARDAVALADRIDAHRRFARLRLASVLLTAGEPGWDELFTEVIDDATRAGDRTDRRSAATSLVLARWLSGRAAEAYRLVSDDVEQGPDHDHDVAWLSSHAYAAMIGLLTGVDRTDLLARHRPVLADEPLFRTRSMLTTAVGLALVDTGHAGEVESLLRDERATPGPRRLDRSLTDWLSVEAAWAAGRLAEALSEASSPKGDDRHPAASHRRLVGAHAARQLGHDVLVGPVPAPAYVAWNGAPLEWRALQCAVEGRHDEATACFDAAASAWDGNDVRSATRCRWAAGDEARLAHADDAAARLQVAVDAAERWGLAPIADRSRASLRRCGRVGRAPQRHGESGLTAREEEILRLVGEGRSSKEIAAALVLGVPTVESFVRSAVRKLGATNRLTAAAQLSRSNLPPS